MRWKWYVHSGNWQLEINNRIRNMGDAVTQEQVNQSLKEWAIYQRWFGETILTEDQVSGSTAILILPCGSGDPKYRDDPNSYVSCDTFCAQVAMFLRGCFSLACQFDSHLTFRQVSRPCPSIQSQLHSIHGWFATTRFAKYVSMPSQLASLKETETIY